MATDHQPSSEANEQLLDSEEPETVSVFQGWKFAMAVLAGVAGFLDSLVGGQPPGYAAGAAVGQAIAIAIFLVVATGISRKVSLLQVNSVRPRLYAGLCIASAVLGAIGGILGMAQGIFVLSYLIFLTIAVIGETLVGSASSETGE